MPAMENGICMKVRVNQDIKIQLSTRIDNDKLDIYRYIL